MSSQILLAYPEGGNEIKTLWSSNEILFSLPDVVRLLASQNVKLSGEGRADNLFGMVHAQLEVLESDEVKEVDSEHYVTEPGLFRLILRDNSKACKKFQRWVLHDVLPSIQKYGTYPAPVVEQDSDVKRIVKTLLLEIEEREKLERKTKAQFQKHERMLNHLSAQLNHISDSNNTNSYISVKDYCNNHGIDETHEQLIFGWCLKICVESAEPTKKELIDGQEIKLFPIHVVGKASKEAVTN